MMIRVRFYLLVCIFLSLLYFPLFLNLDFFPFQIWDEAREAIHAYEMYHSGNYLVAQYEGSPDMWSLKPPMLTWLQCFFIHFLGFGELAIRLPSALSALGTCLLVLQFITNITAKPAMGYISAILLLCFDSFTNIHASRTGDIDALLTFFLTWSMIQCYLFLFSNRKHRHILLFFLSLTCAVLTKGIAGLLFLPVYLFLLVYKLLIINPPHFNYYKNQSNTTKKYLYIIKAWLAFYYKHVYLLIKSVFRNQKVTRNALVGAALFCVCVVGFYLGREILNPGYIEAVAKNEWFARYLHTLEFHQQPFDFYFVYLYEKNLIF